MKEIKMNDLPMEIVMSNPPTELDFERLRELVIHDELKMERDAPNELVPILAKRTAMLLNVRSIEFPGKGRILISFLTGEGRIDTDTEYKRIKENILRNMEDIFCGESGIVLDSIKQKFHAQYHEDVNFKSEVCQDVINSLLPWVWKADVNEILRFIDRCRVINETYNELIV